ncbi:hypothetical protein EDD15DRAFT_2198335 [Pisolithus albus]|nr:hypothetical protein EDD15DRAFT_2198335 [Pisolithus albus]
MHLTLSSEGVRNTTMTNENGQVLYKTSTPHRFGTRTTTLHKVEPNTDPDDMRDHLEAIGEIEWNLMGPSVMRLYGQEMMTNSFIPSHGVTGRKRTFTGPDGLPYRFWLGIGTQLSRNDATSQELARSHTRSLGITGPRRDPFLDIDPSLMHMLDMVVLTFIYVEKLRRDKEKRTKRSSFGRNPHRVRGLGYMW